MVDFNNMTEIEKVAFLDTFGSKGKFLLAGAGAGAGLWLAGKGLKGLYNTMWRDVPGTGLGKVWNAIGNYGKRPGVSFHYLVDEVQKARKNGLNMDSLRWWKRKGSTDGMSDFDDVDNTIGGA